MPGRLGSALQFLLGSPPPAPIRLPRPLGFSSSVWSHHKGLLTHMSAVACVPLSPVASAPRQLQGRQIATKRIHPSLLDAHGLPRAPTLRRGRHFLSYLEQAGRYFSSKFSCGPGRRNHLSTGASREHRISYNCCLWRQHPASCSPAILPGNQQETQLPEMGNQSQVGHNLCFQHSRG